MTNTTVEFVQRGIQVSGPSIEDVREEINTLILRNSQWVECSFTSPIKDAGGLYVSRGHVLLSGEMNG